MELSQGLFGMILPAYICWHQFKVAAASPSEGTREYGREHFIGSKPPNYEDLATLEKNKPSLQQAQYYTNNLSGGADTGWRNYQDYYYWLQAQVDI